MPGMAVEGSEFHLDGSVRERLTAERAEELLEGLSEGITSVKLGGKSFGDGSAEVAARALARAAPSLRHVDIADVIAARPEDEAKRALAQFAEGLTGAKQLISLDLSDNAFGAKGVRAVGDVLAGQTQLESLKLCNNGLAADAGEIITAHLTETSPTKLKLLHFHNNLLESAGAKALAPIVEASPDLEDFRFSALRLHHEGAVRISSALAHNAASLKRLNLSDNNFGVEGANELARALGSTTQLEELNLRDTALADEGVSAVCKVLTRVGGRMRRLDLSGNEITPDGARALGRALKSLCELEDLAIEDNELESAGAKRVAKGISAETHEKLAVIVAAASMIGTTGAAALAEAAAPLPALRVLNLNGNAISASVVQDIQENIGEKLASLSDNDEDEDEDEDGDESEEDDEEDEDDDSSTR